MESRREILFKAYKHLIRVNGECSCEISSKCGTGDLTIRQIKYLKIMDRYKDITFSKLAELTKASKPTISELIQKLIRIDCVYKEKSPLDQRVSFIYLTKRGEGIARLEEMTLYKVVDRILKSLSDMEVEILIDLFNKVT